MTKLTLDAAHANVEFSVKHMMITTIRGHFATPTCGAPTSSMPITSRRCAS